ncbi:4-hydroxybenzoate transporter PcaK [Corynebacterium occultum]|uniref:4-hydroxybenzoate transporter PcaK n=1 Tax=Corynebacterium occultum TaxID=2675219 RepID=A0A6B8W802_9CORY|nr:MFS transporter [Corynebacterium occultum]QGU08067.1 4-hydroxybenzoate transporter PcaK [Corynebacterium occultum]
MDIRQRINTSPMTRYQWFIIGITVFLNALDGFDLVAMAFTSSAVTDEFGFSGTQLGWLLSAALIGVGFGSLLLAPRADRWGRRKILIISIMIDMVGLVLTATADSYGELMFWRFITGIGVGGVLGTVTVIVSENSNNRFRGLAMSIYSAGYGLGASLCGVIAANFIPDYGWESVFFAGAGLTLVALVLTFFFLPESTEFLRTRRAEGDEEKVQVISARMGHGRDVTLGEPFSAVGENRIADLFNKRYLATTLKLWVAFCLINFGFNFANSWTPKLLTETGMSAQQGILGGIMLSFGGTIGSLIFGLLTTRLRALPTLITFSVLSSVILVVFITSTSLPSLAFAAGVGVGMLLNGCITGLYTITPQAYAPTLRATGVGVALAAGRIGAVAGPVIVGYLFDAGWSPTSLYFLAAVVVFITAFVLIGARTYSEDEKIVQAPEKVSASS